MRQQGSPVPPFSPPTSPPPAPDPTGDAEPRSPFWLPLRSVAMLVLAIGMVATAALLVTTTGEEAPAPPGSAGTNPTLPQDPAAQPGGQPGDLGVQPPGAGEQAPEAGAGQPPGGTFATALTSGRLRVELVILPAQSGAANQIHVTGLVPDGNLADIQDLVVTLHPPGGAAPTQVPMDRLAGNHLLATNVPMAAPGTWRIELGMRVRETDIDRTRTIDPFRDVNVATEFPVG